MKMSEVPFQDDIYFCTQLNKENWLVLMENNKMNERSKLAISIFFSFLEFFSFFQKIKQGNSLWKWYQILSVKY